MEQIISLLAVAVSLSMDAFAVSVCKGLSAPCWKPSNGVRAALYFGGFQMLMPLIGYFLGARFQSLVEGVDHWIAFVLLVLIGANMIREACGKEEKQNASFAFAVMLPLALATSIDALIVGITFVTFLEIPIYVAVPVIGLVTGTLSFLGVRIGQRVGAKWEKNAQIFGGVLLILMGVKVLWEHLDLASLLFH